MGPNDNDGRPRGRRRAAPVGSGQGRRSRPSRAAAVPARPGRPARLIGLAGLAALLLGGCSADAVGELQRFGMPEPATDRADRILSLWQGSWIAALVVGVAVWGLIVWAVVAYRKRDERVPAQVRYHMPIEALYTAIPFVIVAVLFYFTARDQTAVLAVDDNDPPEHSVHVVGQQWSWTWNYLPDGEGGTAVHDIGTPERQPDLVLPVGEKVGITVTSPDVVHSFFVPAFLFKMDAFPGQENYFELTPTREGDFKGKCAELCGTYHSRMLFTVRVVSPAEYDAHVAELERRGQTGLVSGGSDITDQQGLEQENAS